MTMIAKSLKEEVMLKKLTTLLDKTIIMSSTLQFLLLFSSQLVLSLHSKIVSSLNVYSHTCVSLQSCLHKSYSLWLIILFFIVYQHKMSFVFDVTHDLTIFIGRGHCGKVGPL
jgi:hypothetical protein